MWYGLSPTNYKMKSAARVGVQRREDHLPPWSVNFKIWLGVYFLIPWFVDNNVFPWASTLLPSLSCPVSLDLNWRCPSVENPELTSQINSVLDQLFSSHFYNFLLDQKSVTFLSLVFLNTLVLRACSACQLHWLSPLKDSRTVHQSLCVLLNNLIPNILPHYQ